MAEIAAILGDRNRDICARAGLAGCVAVALFGIAASAVWIITGTPRADLGQLAFAVPVVFAVTAAVRGLGGIILRDPDPVKVVAVDVGICVAGLVLIASAGSLANSGGFALYTVVVVAPFFLPAVLVASVIIEIVLHHTWPLRAAVALAAVTGILALAIFGLVISGG